MHTPKHIRDLTPDPENVRKHNPRNIGMIEKSLNEVGAARSIVTDENNVILAGNGTIEAAAAAGITKVLTVDTDGETIVNVRRRGLTPEQKKRLALFDNRTTDLSGWNAEALAALDADMTAGMFTDEELAELLKGVEGDAPVVDAEAQIDEGARLAQKYGVKTGQVWQLGDHALYCGDNRDVLPTLGRFDLLLTDPPYGVKRDAGMGVGGLDGFGKGQTRAPKQYPGKWDNKPPDPEELLAAVAACARSVVWGGNYVAHFLPKSTQWLVWDKQQTMPSYSDCELAWTTLGGTATRRIVIPQNGMLAGEKDRVHPTQKPVELMRWCITLADKNGKKSVQTIFDPYSGSGTTIMAAETLGRTCTAIEREPSYVAVTLQRYMDATGTEPRLLG